MVKERVVVVPSDDESDREVVNSTTKQSLSASKATSRNNEPDPIDEDEEDDGDEGSGADSEEFEIEEILDAKHGTFPDGRMGYLVKWKGYSEEHNSWVDEKDAGNAVSLIAEFWRKSKVEKKSRGGPKVAARHSTGTVGTTKGRKSMTREESSEVEETRQKLEVRTKKRGRPSKASMEQDQEEDEEPEREPEKKKRARKSTNGTKAKAEVEAMDEDEPEQFTSMKQWSKASTWEHLVESIDTVERISDGRLLVYFTLKNNKGRGREESSVCRDKLKNMLLDFYEKNLRWREDTEAMQE